MMNKKTNVKVKKQAHKWVLQRNKVKKHHATVRPEVNFSGHYKLLPRFVHPNKKSHKEEAHYLPPGLDLQVNGKKRCIKNIKEPWNIAKKTWIDGPRVSPFVTFNNRVYLNETRRTIEIIQSKFNTTTKQKGKQLWKTEDMLIPVDKLI